MTYLMIDLTPVAWKDLEKMYLSMNTSYGPQNMTSSLMVLDIMDGAMFSPPHL